jgi:hypothetical protein
VSAAVPARGVMLGTSTGRLYAWSWTWLRLLIGIMGLAMPIILIVGERVLFPSDAVDFPRSSLSAYYYSGLRDVFVATLVATGVFLLTYMALHRGVDNVVTSLAGAAAVLVAYDPTGPEPGETATAWARLIGVHTCQTIHYGAALVFLAGCAVMSLRFAEASPRPALHVGCAAGMTATGIVALTANAVGVQRVGAWSGLLIVELVVTYLFGLSWLAKGLELRSVLVRDVAGVDR